MEVVANKHSKKYPIELNYQDIDKTISVVFSLDNAKKLLSDLDSAIKEIEKSVGMTQEEIDKELMEIIPKEDLTEEEFNEAKRIWESERNMLKVVKYLQSVEYGNSSKLAKGYFDLYIDDRNYE